MKRLPSFLLCLFVQLPLCANPLWSGTETGMSATQLLKKFEGATAPVDPEKLETGTVEKVCIPSFKYLGHDFAVRFYFSGSGLEQVALELKNPGKRQDLKKLVEAVVLDLSRTLGKPERSGSENSAATTLQVAWNLSNQRVPVIAVSFGPTEELSDGGIFRINYQQPEVKAPNNPAKSDGDKPPK